MPESNPTQEEVRLGVLDQFFKKQKARCYEFRLEIDKTSYPRWDLHSIENMNIGLLQSKNWNSAPKVNINSKLLKKWNRMVRAKAMYERVGGIFTYDNSQ